MKYTFNWFTNPLSKDFSYIIIVFLLIVPSNIYNYINNHAYIYALEICFHGYALSYCMCFIGQCLPTKSYKIYKHLLLFIAVISFILDLHCLLMYRTRFHQDFATIIVQTNTSEIKEYIESYISVKHILIITIILLLFIAVYNRIKMISINITQVLLYLSFATIIIGTTITLQNPYIFKEIYIGKMIASFQIPKIPNLKEYSTNPQVVSTTDYKPQNIVMIIGESFSKSHSSLYNYHKETNPYLHSLATKDSLFVFQNIISPTTSTIPCFQAIMSTYKLKYGDSIAWYKCANLPEILHKSNYYTYWVSNQSKVGLHDTYIGRYADLCNQNFFVGNKYAGMNRTNLDEGIIPLLKPLIHNSQNNNFYFIHLMGSHSTFKNRYPESYNSFKIDDYKDRPKHQREKLAEYDNSILYNDSVVYEIIRLFQNKEAIVLYFSDHSIDVYESSDDYIGHARKVDSKSVKVSRNIPFIIYTSTLYQQRFPQKMNLIKKSIENHYCTEDVIYTIMDIIGITIDGESLKEKSLFQITNAH